MNLATNNKRLVMTVLQVDGFWCRSTLPMLSLRSEDTEDQKHRGFSPVEECKSELFCHSMTVATEDISQLTTKVAVTFRKWNRNVGIPQHS